MIKLVKLEAAVAFDPAKMSFHLVLDEQIGPLPDATQTIDLDPLKAATLVAGGLKGEIGKLFGVK